MGNLAPGYKLMIWQAMNDCFTKLVLSFALSGILSVKVTHQCHPERNRINFKRVACNSGQSRGGLCLLGKLRAFTALLVCCMAREFGSAYMRLLLINKKLWCADSALKFRA